MSFRILSNHFTPLDSIFDRQVAEPLTRIVSLPLHELSTTPQQHHRNRTYAHDSMTTDVVETEQEYSITVDVPGYENLNASIDKNILTIEGERKHVKRQDTAKVHLSERHYGKLHRQFKLPARADPNKAEAKLHEGVLSIVIVKRELEKPSEPRKLLSVKPQPKPNNEVTIHKAAEEKGSVHTEMNVSEQQSTASSTSSVTVEDVEDDAEADEKA